MKKKIGKLFIIFGIVIICSVLYLNYNVSKENRNLVNDYKNSLQESETNNGKKYLNDIVGILSIPKINLEVAVKKGTDNETLKYAVGQFENSVMPGEYGNFAIAGHRAYTHNKFFSNLDEVEIGDELSILSGDINYKYRVDSIEVVTPDKVDVVDTKDKEKKEITLVTCTPKYVGSHRLVVKGQYVE